MNKDAEDIKKVFAGMKDAMSGIGNAFARNDAWVELLKAWLASQKIDMGGFSMRHYDRDGKLEYVLRVNSVSKGLPEDTLYQTDKAGLRKWGQKNNPSLIEKL